VSGSGNVFGGLFREEKKAKAKANRRFLTRRQSGGSE
jgi:hypothetical protein